MKLLPALLFLAATVLPLSAQTDGMDATSGPMHGTLYINVDQVGTIYLNGTKIAVAKGQHNTAIALSPGDRLVVKTTSGHAYRHLGMLFVSDDKTTEISFRVAHFKLLPDPETTDFTADQFNDFPKKVIPYNELPGTGPQKDSSSGKTAFPVKNDSEFFWGDAKAQDCAVGALITADMFTLVPQ